MTRADHLDPKDFVTVEDEVTGEKRAVRHEKGTFVFRLAGRERQQSASYYTPEVLTRFTVSQALAELLDQDGHRTTAGEILQLTVCEPALGSGAFAIEAVRQLAAEYLKRRQDELDERIDPDEYATELQKVKAYIALHQVHGSTSTARRSSSRRFPSGSTPWLRGCRRHGSGSASGEATRSSALDEPCTHKRSSRTSHG